MLQMKDYETSKTIFNLPLPNIRVARIQISPDGSIVAYATKEKEDVSLFINIIIIPIVFRAVIISLLIDSFESW